MRLFDSSYDFKYLMNHQSTEIKKLDLKLTIFFIFIQECGDTTNCLLYDTDSLRKVLMLTTAGIYILTPNRHEFLPQTLIL